MKVKTVLESALFSSLVHTAHTARCSSLQVGTWRGCSQHRSQAFQWLELCHEDYFLGILHKKHLWEQDHTEHRARTQVRAAFTAPQTQNHKLLFRFVLMLVVVFLQPQALILPRIILFELSAIYESEEKGNTESTARKRKLFQS